MTSWPILERELRIWARRRATYWSRAAVAAGGLLVCAPVLFWSGPFAAPGTAGHSAFQGLVGAAFLLCCAACLLTADAISGERRDGTLGLLLLTRVKHLDLLLGKLASTGLASALGLLAFMPVLSLPLLTGGVSVGEAARAAVALLVTLFLALCAGIWVSVRGRERFQTSRTALLLVAGLVLGPATLGRILPQTHVGLASPLTAISRAADLAYRGSGGAYWSSIGLVQTLSWGFLLAAVAGLGRRLDVTDVEEASQHGATEPAPGHRAGAAVAAGDVAAVFPAGSRSAAPWAETCSYCGRRNNAGAVFCHECGTELHPRPVRRTGVRTLASAPTPLHWLLARQRGLALMLWVAAVVGCSQFALFQMIARSFAVNWGSVFFSYISLVGLATTMVESGLFAWVASRFWIEARRSGELELLLTTPLGAEQLVSTQWGSLKRLARWPVLVMVGLPLVVNALVTFRVANPAPDLWRLYRILSLLLGAATTLLNVGAVFRVAAWLGRGGLGQGRLIFWTLLLVRGLPYAAEMAWGLLYRSVMARPQVPGNWWPGSLWFLSWLVPQILTLLYYLWLIHWASSQLRHCAGDEQLGPLEVLARARDQVVAWVHRSRNWPAV